MFNMKKPFLIVCLLALLIPLQGCTPREKTLAPSAADQLFIKIMDQDYGTKAKTFWADNTLWIYLPDDNREIFNIASNQKASSSPVPRKFSLQYFEGSENAKTFLFEYDIVTATKAAAGVGISTQYSEAFNTQYRNAVTAVTRAYFGAEKLPEFIVIVLSDVTKGIEIQNTICALDLKKYYASALSPDEYSLRVLSETKGDEEIVGDFKGHHLKIATVVWPEFLSKQIAQRVRYKFQNSSFPPEETPQNEILKIIATTMMIYDFHDYDTVVLNDLRSSRAENFTRSQVEALEDKSILGKERKPTEGKIITIDFSKFLEEKPEESSPAEKTDAPSSENSNTTP